MRCIVRGCDLVSSCTSTSKGVTFHTFPSETALCQAWLESLKMIGWKFTADSGVCSRHFQKDDLYVSREGHCCVRDGAIPTIHVPIISKSDDSTAPCDIKVCRICFATDCTLYPMTKYKDLDRAYEILTGLIIQNNDDLPPYLCFECSHRLLKCIQFRTRSIQANLVLQKITEKHDRLTLEAIKSNNEYQRLSSSLGVTHKRMDDYDLDVIHVEIGNVHTSDNRQTNETCISYEVNIIKVEKDDELNQDSDGSQDVTCESMSPPRLHEVILPGIKLEKDDFDNQDSHENITNNAVLPILDDNVGINIKMEKIETTNQDGVEKDSGHISHGDMLKGEDYSSDDGLSLGEQALGGNIQVKMQNTVDQHWKPLAESSEISLFNDKLPREIYIYRTERKIKSLDHININDEIDTQNQHLDVIDKRNQKFQVRKKCNIQRYLCDICKKTFTRKHKLQLHLRIHSGEKPYLCKVCKSAFVTNYTLKVHMRIHSGEKPYKCSVCERSFSQKSNLNIHLRTHSGEKPYTCSLCVKSFAQKSNLNKHFIIHSGEKPFSCNFCNKLFTVKCNLKKHLIVHSGEMRYFCRYCNKGFNENNPFQDHMRVHAGEKPFSCNVCEKAFSVKSSVQSHLKIQ